MGSWGIGINWAHVAVWRRFAYLWLGYVGLGLVAGAHLGPRPDEIAFVLLLPLAVVVPYGLACLGLVALKLRLVGLQHWRVRALRFYADKMLGQKSRA